MANGDVSFSPNFLNDGDDVAEGAEYLHLVQFYQMRKTITGERFILYLFGWLSDDFFDRYT
jgi:hypothetical protein